MESRFGLHASIPLDFPPWIWPPIGSVAESGRPPNSQKSSNDQKVSESAITTAPQRRFYLGDAAAGAKLETHPRQFCVTSFARNGLDGFQMAPRKQAKFRGRQTKLPSFHQQRKEVSQVRRPVLAWHHRRRLRNSARTTEHGYHNDRRPGR